MHGWEITLLGVISFLVGILAGTVGLALGAIRLPALHLMDVPAEVAASTNLITSTVAALMGATRYARAHRVDWPLVAVMGIPSAIGAFVGGFGSDVAPEALLVISVGAFVTWQGVEFFRLARVYGRQPVTGGVAGEQEPRALTSGYAVLEGSIGFTIGLAGGAVGLILGGIRLPAIVRTLHIPPHVAAGTNLVIGVLTGIGGFIGHGVKGEVDPSLLAGLLAGGVVGTYLGAGLASRLQPRTLITLMSVVLIIVGALLLREGVSRA